MYQRKYYKEDAAVKVPENYSGMAIETEEYIDEADVTAAGCDTPTHAVPMPPSMPQTRLHSVPDRSECAPRPHAGLYESVEGFCRRIGLHMPAFNREDILLIGVALVLFFSKDGDKECAIMLIALLFLS